MSAATAFVNPASKLDEARIKTVCELLAPAGLHTGGGYALQVATNVRKARTGELGGDVFVLINGVKGSLSAFGVTERELKLGTFMANLLGQNVRVSVKIVLNIPTKNDETYDTDTKLDMSLDATYERAQDFMRANRGSKTH